MKVEGTNEEMSVHLHLVHESGNRVSIELDNAQIESVTNFIKETGKLFSERQEGLNVKFWITGSIRGTSVEQSKGLQEAQADMKTLVEGKKPPPLTDLQKEILTAWSEGEQIVFVRGRQNGIKILERAYNELPAFLKRAK